MPDKSAVETLSAGEVASNTPDGTVYCSAGSDVITDGKWRTRSWSGPPQTLLAARKTGHAALTFAIVRNTVVVFDGCCYLSTIPDPGRRQESEQRTSPTTEPRHRNRYNTSPRTKGGTEEHLHTGVAHQLTCKSHLLTCNSHLLVIAGEGLRDVDVFLSVLKTIPSALPPGGTLGQDGTRKTNSGSSRQQETPYTRLKEAGGTSTGR
ncbi:Hypp4444 [Branchiostoma lanceolatum]|uniref:Hypp4444 protein n=1 Tax=Branchiostoma lanceolatum TaxID=7740 RepID=A0A8K0A8L0_BRALA|nr:Hypp4444 [Branchiostoma lanceolatum]